MNHTKRQMKAKTLNSVERISKIRSEIAVTKCDLLPEFLLSQNPRITWVWMKPELIEDTVLNQVTLYLKMIPEHEEQSAKKTAEKSAESAEKSAEKHETLLSERQKQILACMELDILYKTEEIAKKIGLKGPRTRQLLNELVAMGRLTCTAATKNRRYIRIE